MTINEALDRLEIVDQIIAEEESMAYILTPTGRIPRRDYDPSIAQEYKKERRKLLQITKN